MAITATDLEPQASTACTQASIDAQLSSSQGPGVVGRTPFDLAVVVRLRSAGERELSFCLQIFVSKEITHVWGLGFAGSVEPNCSNVVPIRVDRDAIEASVQRPRRNIFSPSSYRSF